MTDAVLVADVGGTNARFAMAELDGPTVPRFEIYPCAKFRSLPEAVAAYVKDTGVKPKAASFAVAGPVTGESATITNLSWTMTCAELRAATGASAVMLVNDFEALALSVSVLKGADLRQIGGKDPAPRATKGVVGPGTGLGVGGVVWSASRWMPIPGEGGHISLAVETAEEFAVHEFIRARHGLDHVSNERICSGPGLVNLYAFFAAKHGIELKERVGANETTRRALAREDPVAIDALNFFVQGLGRIAGDTALTLGARGGLYLGGGIPPKIQDWLAVPAFRKAFESKGRLTAFLKPIPVFVILANDAGLRGAAIALKLAMAEGRV